MAIFLRFFQFFAFKRVEIESISQPSPELWAKAFRMSKNVKNFRGGGGVRGCWMPKKVTFLPRYIQRYPLMEYFKLYLILPYPLGDPPPI